MTSTQIVTSQSIGTGANKGSDLFAYRLTPQSITDRFFVEIRQTNGAAGYDIAQRVIVRWATYNASATASTMPPILRNAARYLELIPSPAAGEARSRLSLCEPLSGPYLYLWFEIPILATAATLDAWVHEGP